MLTLLIIFNVGRNIVNRELFGKVLSMSIEVFIGKLREPIRSYVLSSLTPLTIILDVFMRENG